MDEKEKDMRERERRDRKKIEINGKVPQDEKP